MGVMRWAFYDKLKELYPNVKMTYGYITKNTRIKNNLPKGHRVDALCITGNSNIERLYNWFYMKKVRRHNRKTHRAKILKGGKRKLNQAPYEVLGFRLFDKVKYNNQECFIFARRETGQFCVRLLNGTKIRDGVNYKKLKLVEKRKGILFEAMT